MKRLFLITVAALLGLIGSASAQPMSPCQGLKNPASFTSGPPPGSNMYGYSGQIGTKPNSQPNPLTGQTGMNMTGSVIPASQLSSQASSGSCQGLESNKRFRIMSSTEGPGTGTQLGKEFEKDYFHGSMTDRAALIMQRLRGIRNDQVRLFVYGTLMKKQRANKMLEGSQYCGKFMLNDYAMYDFGAYPGIKEKRIQPVGTN